MFPLPSQSFRRKMDFSLPLHFSPSVPRVQISLRLFLFLFSFLLFISPPFLSAQPPSPPSSPPPYVAMPSEDAVPPPSSPFPVLPAGGTLSADPTVIYPRNITATYKGRWALLPSSPRPPSFSYASGIIAYRFHSYPLIAPSSSSIASPSSSPLLLHYLNGEMLVRDGDYPTSHDLRLYLRGFYSPSSGYLYVNTNSRQWLNVSSPLSALSLLFPNASSSQLLLSSSLLNATSLSYRSSEEAHMEYEGQAFSPCFSSLLLRMGPSSQEMEDALTKLRQDAAALEEEEDTQENEEKYRELRDEIKKLKREMKMEGELRPLTPGEGEEEEVKREKGAREGLDPEEVAKELSSCPSFSLSLSAAVLDPSSYYSKAQRFIYFSLAVSLAQIVFVYRQMKYSSSSSRLLRVSLLTIALQALLDSLACLFHLITGFVVDPLFNSFVFAALVEFICFSLFGFRFLLLIYRARYPSLFSGSREATRASLTRLYGQFYLALFFGLLVMYRFQSLLLPLLFLLYSFWIPQIAWSAYNGSRRGLKREYILSLTCLRLLCPLYVFLCPVNWLSVQPQPRTALALCIYLAAQVGVIMAQEKWGPRFFIHQKLLPKLPKKYDYHRERPEKKHKQGGEEKKEEEKKEEEKKDMKEKKEKKKKAKKKSKNGAVYIGVGESESVNDEEEGNDHTLEYDEEEEDQQRGGREGGEREEKHYALDDEGDADSVNSQDGLLSEEKEGRDNHTVEIREEEEKEGTSEKREEKSLSPSSPPSSALPDEEEEEQCSICCSDLPLSLPLSSVMVCPCNHCYHKECLLRWMRQKLQCPLCRAPLPPYSSGNEEEGDESERDEEEAGEPRNMPIASPVEREQRSIELQQWRL